MKMDLLVKKQVFRVETGNAPGELDVFKMNGKEVGDFALRIGITEGSLEVRGSAPDYRDRDLQTAILEAIVDNSHVERLQSDR
jgi:hypothetical protein